MATSTLENLRRRREELLAIAARSGTTNIRIFGSVARDEDAAISDVDFLVRMERGRSLLDLVALRDDLEAAIARRVDIVTENGISPYLRQRILAEATPL